MSTVPVYMLRKPWFVILQFSTKKPRHPKRSESYLGEVIEQIDVQLPSEKEAEFNSSLNIFFNSFYRIKNAHIGKVLSKLVTIWFNTSKNDPPSEIDLLRTRAFNGRKTDPARSILQDQIHRALSQPSGHSKSSSVKVELDLARFLCEWAIMAAKDEENTVIVLKSIKLKIEELYGNIQKKPKEGITHFENIPDSFNNSEWICYERTDAPDKKKTKSATGDATWGIAASVVSIGSMRGYAPTKFISQFDTTRIESKGTSSFDAGYLIVALRRNDNVKDKAFPATPIWFFMKVRDAPAQTAMVGLYLYYSIRFDRYLTKTVVWQKKTSEVKNQDLPYDITNKDKEFKKIDLSIRRYLYNRTKNRLTIPSKGISNLFQLKKDKDAISLPGFLNKHIGNILEKREELKAILGKFCVCYFSGDPIIAKNDIKKSTAEGKQSEYLKNNIRTDELSIDFDEEAVAFQTEYTHHHYDHNIPYAKNNDYYGDLFISNNTFQIRLSSDKDNADRVRSNPVSADLILLSFVASKEIDKNSKWDFFEGIISGVRDNGAMPSAFRTLIVRNSSLKKTGKEPLLNFKTDNPRKISKSIIRYFEENILKAQIEI